MKGSLLVLAVFVLGIFAGTQPGLPMFLRRPDLALYALYLLLFLVGVGMGANQQAWKMLRRLNLRILLVPLGVIVGTLVGVALFSLLLPALSLRQALAVGAGFGYYSLSSILITQLHSEALGVVALLANMMREVGTLLLTPWLVGRLGKVAPVAAGGATTMDTTLPVIVRYAGSDTAIVAFFSGVILTLLVPLLVTLLL
ncbi:MAG: lysine exporter LysO family protein [Ardenticatenales bacterium]|nr:lysine exporter LysO family protein [Ardenticatenales bacterium]